MQQLLPELAQGTSLEAEKMSLELIAHGVFSFLSGVSVAITGFGCDSARELFAELSTGPNTYPESSAINMGLSAALVTAVQVRGGTVPTCTRQRIVASARLEARMLGAT